MTEIKKNLTLLEMKACLEIWDQTIGCSNCMEGWWSDNSPDNVLLFHNKECPLYGNREAHEDMVDLDYLDKELGYKAGSI